MERLFDDLSKRLAKAVSRRDMLTVTSRTVLGTLFASTWVGKLWGRTAAVASTSPSCGTCQTCNAKTGKCGLDCEVPCAAALLSDLARLFEPYLTLQDFLVQQQFTGGEPQALVVINSDDTISTVLGTSYTGSLPNQTAQLMFTLADIAPTAYAVQFLDGSPQFGYFVSATGQIQQVLTPYDLITTANAASTQAEAPEKDLATSTSQSRARSGAAANACKEGCDLLCDYVLSDVCTNLAGADCASTIVFGPEAPVLCFLLAASLCSVLSDPLCTTLCQSATCTCQPGSQPCGLTCCGPCQSCSGSGLCTAMTCPSGYSCSSTIGTCECNTALCGGACCAGGQTCTNGECGTPCPAGTTACGATCCLSGQTCTNGQCVVTSTCAPNSCPSGEPCCISALGNSGCGPAGYYCCSTGFGACPAETTCCGLAAGPTGWVNFCCSPGSTCYTSPSGPAAGCCSAGTIGCSAPGIGEIWCCGNGTSCGSTLGTCV